MELKELRAFKKQFVALCDSETEGTFDDGVNACVAIIDEAIKKANIEEKIAKLHAEIAQLESKLQGDINDEKSVEVKPPTKRRPGRPKTQPEATTEAASV